MYSLTEHILQYEKKHSRNVLLDLEENKQVVLYATKNFDENTLTVKSFENDILTFSDSQGIAYEVFKFDENYTMSPIGLA